MACDSARETLAFSHQPPAKIAHAKGGLQNENGDVYLGHFVSNKVSQVNVPVHVVSPAALPHALPVQVYGSIPAAIFFTTRKKVSRA
jgi:hypothetical protein